jgi:predicted SAM-dependent methyltransferase
MWREEFDMNTGKIANSHVLFECPYCQGIFDEFIPWPDKFDFPQVTYEMWNKHTAICPFCYSTDRERMYKLYMEWESDFLSTPLNVFHINPENRLQVWLGNQPNIHQEIVYAAEDMKQLDYQDQTFDVIVCSHVLEHMKDDILMMKELYRVMKDTGWGIFQVPIALSLKRTYEDPYIITPEERNRAYGQEDHVRIYARKDYIGRLKSAGFTFKPIHVSEICEKNIWKYGFSQTDVLYIVTKEKDQNISFLKRLYHKIFGK